MALSLQMAKTAQRATLLSTLNRGPISLAATRLQSSSRADCGEDPAPRCGSKNLTKAPCDASKKKEKEKKKDEAFKSMWENPECCKDPCPDVLPRFDELYYKTSDKATRVYKQTWVECPEKKIVLKPICEYDKLIYPPLEKRPRKDRPKTAKCDNDCELMKCFSKTNSKCAKITLPGCRASREPPKCKQTRTPSDCKKVCCPYPSFSECKKPRPKPRHPVECRCLDTVALCEVYAALKKMSFQQK